MNIEDEVQDPTIQPERLAQIAAEHPELWSQVLANPNCYPGLRGWIEQQMPSVPPMDKTELLDATGEATQEFSRSEVSAAGYPTMQYPAQDYPQANAAQSYSAAPQSTEGKRNLLWLWILLGIIAVALIVGALYWFLGRGSSPAAETSDRPAATQEEPTSESATPEGSGTPQTGTKPAPEQQGSAEVNSPSTRETCEVLGNGATGFEPLALEDPAVIREAARVFDDAAAVAPADIKSELQELAEAMKMMADLVTDPTSASVEDVEDMEEMISKLESMRTNAESVQTWAIDNCLP